MTVDHAETAKPAPAAGDTVRRLNGATRGLVFIWLGLAVLAKLGWGWTLLGIGVVVLGEQAARWRMKRGIAARWALGGAVFLIGGLWQLFDISFPLAPLMLILLGAVIIWNGFFGAQAD